MEVCYEKNKIKNKLNKVNPDRIIQTIEENFKDVLTKPNLKNLLYDYKAFVVAISFRRRAIPIAFKIYTNQQIKNMEYASENHIIWNFMDVVIDFIKKILLDKKVIFVFDRGFADEKLMKYMECFASGYIIYTFAEIMILS